MPKDDIPVYKVVLTDISTSSFSPFSLRSGLPNMCQILITDPKHSVIYLAELSPDLHSLEVLQIIRCNEIRKPIDCIPVNCQNQVLKQLLVSDADPLKPSLHLLDVYNDIKYNCSISDPSMKFPFGLCDTSNLILLSDPKAHCLFKVDINCRTVISLVGEEENECRNDGPLETAKLSSPTGVACRSDAVYIAEHPKEFQGAVRVCHSLTDLILYQTIWFEISRVFSQLSKREIRNNSKEVNEQLKVRNLQDAFPEMEDPCQKLHYLTESISNTFNSNSLDITHGFMSSKTAKAVYNTLRNGLCFILEYFDYIELEELKSKVITHCLTDKLVECFFGHVTERSSGNSPRLLEFARIVANDTFYFSLSVISSSGASEVSIGKTRHERPVKYSYSSVDIEDEELSKLLWELHSISQEEMFLKIN